MIRDDNLVASSFVVSSCSLKYVLANVDEPTGVPRSLNPSVSSTGVVVPSAFFLLEYLEIVSAISVARSWSAVKSAGRMLWLEQDVRILVFWGLTKHPRGRPNLSISEQKNLMSL